MRSEADGAKNPRTVINSGVQMVSSRQLFIGERGRAYIRGTLLPRAAVYTDQVEEIAQRPRTLLGGRKNTSVSRGRGAQQKPYYYPAEAPDSTALSSPGLYYSIKRNGRSDVSVSTLG